MLTARTIQDVLKGGTELLTPKSESARLDAEVLMALSLNKPREFLYAWPDTELSEAQLENFHALLERRAAGEPVAYITGWREFWSLTLMVTPDTLIPRPETERLVEIALTHIPDSQQWRVADIGTGTGAISAALAVERPLSHFIGVDISEACVEIAQANIARLDLTNVEVRNGHLCDALEDAPVQMIVSNPPYVADEDPHLLNGDPAAEPRLALVGGPDGLNLIRELATQAPGYLTSGGRLIIEHGYDQGEAVRNILRDSGFVNAVTYRDYGGNERVTSAEVRESRPDA